MRVFLILLKVTTIIIIIYIIQIIRYEYNWSVLFFSPIILVISFFMNTISNLYLNSSIFLFRLQFNLNQYISFLRKNKYLIVHQLNIVIIEEFIWRVIPNWLLFIELGLSVNFSIIINFIFTYIHFANLRKIKLKKIIEMLTFFTLCSYLYYYTNEFIFIVIIHLNRNLTIYYFQSILKRLDEV